MATLHETASGPINVPHARASVNSIRLMWTPKARDVRGLEEAQSSLRAHIGMARLSESKKGSRMTCYSGFGKLTDGKHPSWAGDFNGDGRSEILFHYSGDSNWWLGTFADTTLSWRLVGNTAGFGNLLDGRPIWTGDFAGTGKTDVLFYFPGDKNWWIGQFNNNDDLVWSLAGNTAGFGQIWDGRPVWTGDFTGDGKRDILFYYPGDRNWWLGRFDGTRLVWNLAANTVGFGQIADGRPIWAADFAGTGKTDILFYYPGDKNWWLGQFGTNNQIAWSLAGNTAGFGQVGDGRPIRIGDFTGDGKADVLFYYPGDKNWWLGRFSGGQLSWNLAGNTAGFGQVGDGRPFWAADFTGTGSTDILFYYPGDKNWWIGQFGATGQMTWNLAGNTAGFGQVWDGRPFWTADFTGDGKTDVLFYFPGDGNWWLGKFTGNQMNWFFAGNTGRPCSESCTVHFKSLIPVTDAVRQFMDAQFNAMHELYSEGGVRASRGTFEDLSNNANLATLRDLDVGQCLLGQPTAEQNTLFANRNNAGSNDMVVYVVTTLTGGAGNFVGCATHPNGQPGAAVVQSSAQWLVAHELGHVLGLRHVNNSDFLMNPNTGWTNPPPNVAASEFATMLSSGLTNPC